jgi:hypothetical protein
MNTLIVGKAITGLSAFVEGSRRKRVQYRLSAGCHACQANPKDQPRAGTTKNRTNFGPADPCLRVGASIPF